MTKDLARKISENERSATQEASALQRSASDPDVSAWVGASAGSGKTKVLTDRILRLLLPRADGRPGTAPEKILALTFTKAAASEMALRLSRRLSEWAVLDDAGLKAQLEDLTGEESSEAALESARTLFARVMETPGGLKIMTIHSFCQSVLARFPLEAGLKPGFQALEEEDANRLLKEAQRLTLREARAQPGSSLAGAVNLLGMEFQEDALETVLRIIAAERREVAGILRRSFGADGLYANLCAMLDITPAVTGEEALIQFCEGANRNWDGLRKAVAALFASQKKNDLDKAYAMAPFLEAKPSERVALYETYKRGFLTDKGAPYATPCTKDAQVWSPGLDHVLIKEAADIVALEQYRKAAQAARTTEALFLFAEKMLASYERLKAQKGALDFDDLILRTLSLLKGDALSGHTSSGAGWVMYKLDEGIDHILVDEAQDTNPEQWDIIRLLCDDFFSGLGQKADTKRTLFVVGDEKQSIFSFQRAAPEKFGDMHDYFSKKITAAGDIFRTIDISTSFRSTQIVLDAVDTVFLKEEMRQSLGNRYNSHRASRTGQGGKVEVWPILKNDDQETKQAQQTGWGLPDKVIESRSGSFKMAEKIGDTIQNWLATGEVLEAYGRLITPGDIMILVRSRGAFVNQMVRALKTRNIQVSGVDRMILNEQIVVHDLCAAASFALLPEDDLTLACLLKSPFIGMSEEDLYHYAHQRTGSLWDAIVKTGDSALITWLGALVSSPYKQKPYAFFSNLLARPCPADAHNGMRAIRARLGEDALDPLDEFLNQSLRYERLNCGGLQRFLQSRAESASDIKREMEEGGRAVRIMTVHGAKGLQAPIVFLPDTIRTSANAKPEKLLWPSKTGLDWPLYVPSVEQCPEPVKPVRDLLQDRMNNEYRRLLYVAMTRAEERLYIGGFFNKRGPGKSQTLPYWYQDIVGGIENHPDIRREGEAGEHNLVLKTVSEVLPDKAKNMVMHSVLKPALFPKWLYSPAPEEPAPPRPLVPSRPSLEEQPASSPLASADPYRFQRGTVTHRLLQFMPAFPRPSRLKAAQAYLESVRPALPSALQDDVLKEVVAILDNPLFADAFGENSLAEVPVTGLLSDGRLISGQIDRFCVRSDDVLIIDFKTNRPPPLIIQDVPQVYVLQMRAYADALRALYPEKTVRAGLLWTDGPRLMEIPV